MFNRKILLMILLVSPVFAFSSESSAMWMRLYNRIDILDYKLDIMKNIVEEDSRDIIPLLNESLIETNLIRKNITNENEKHVYNELQMLAVKKLGELKAVESADNIFRIVNETDNIILKGESIIALGRMGSDKYSKQFNLMLRNLNMRLTGSKSQRNDEIIAYALVLMFEDLKLKETYESVFHSSTGWYSSRSKVKQRAKTALKKIVEDPTDILTKIMKRDSNFTNKYAALTAEYESEASNENMSKFAVAALDEGITYVSNDLTEKTQLSRIRTLACEMITASSSKPEEAIPYLEEILFSRFDLNEKLTSIETLGSYTTADAALTLSKFLKQQNEWKYEGMSRMIDRRSVLAVINAMGNTGNKAALEELRIVGTAEWTGTVKREAKAAIEKINKSN
jgi:hypothetical protein